MNHQAWPLLLNTLLLASLTGAVSLPVGTLLGWLLVRTDVPGRRLAIVLLGVLFFVPLYLQAAAWQVGFGLQGWTDLVQRFPAWMHGWTEVVWIHSLAAIPWVTMITAAGFWLVEPELEEQALLDGTAWQVFWRVTLHQAAPAVGVAAAWVAIVTAGEMTVTDLFQVRTYAEEVYTRMAIGQDPAEAAVGILPGLVLTAGLVAVALLILARLVPRDRPLTVRQRWTFRWQRGRIPAAVLLAAMLVVLVGLPLASLIYKAGLIATLGDAGPVRAWSLVKCLGMVAMSPVRYAQEFGWSLVLSLSSATTAVVLAGGLVWWARHSRAATASALVIAAVAMAVPGPLVGIAVIGLLNRPEVPALTYLYDQTIAAPWLALAVRSLPPAIFILWHTLRTIPPEMLDAAAVDGAGPVARFWRIALPCRWSAFLLAWTVAMAVSLGELAANILVVPPGVTTLSIRIFNLLHYGVEDQVAGICLALVLLFAGVAALILWLGRRSGERDI
jgi:iron(III) transport system permease protein